MKNPFPRGSMEPTQTPAKANVNATDTSPRRAHTQADFDELAGLSTNAKPTLRDMESNTADGRVSRYASSPFEDTNYGDKETGSEANTAMVDGCEPYGDAGGPTVHTQGGMPRNLDGSPDLPEGS